MVETSHSDCRSHKGCWTCRARRKKCDESSQPCKTCAGLRLTCHGYGPRPEWMDRAEKEKAKVLEFKAIVKRNLKQKRRSTITSQHEAGLADIRPQSSHLDNDEIRVQHPLPSPLSPFEGTSFDFSSIPDASPTRHDNRNSNAFDNLFTTNSLEEYIDLDTLDNFPWDVNQTHPHSEQDPFASPQATDILSTQAEGSSGINTVDGSVFTTHGSEGHATVSSISSIGSPDPNLVQWSRPKPAPLSASDQTIVDSYFQRSFGSQLPFLDDSTSSQIAAQLSVLAARSRACLESLALHAIRCNTFALNGLGLNLTGDTSQAANAYEQTVIRCIRRFDDSHGFTSVMDLTAIEAQMCAVQMIHSRVVCRYPTWHHQMDVLASVKPIDYNRAAAGEFNGLQVYQELLICLDILASTTTGASPAFAVQFGAGFENGNIRLESIIGCSTEVMSCIMLISELQVWSHDHSENASTSLIELARRALKVEQELENAKRQNKEGRGASSPGRNAGRTEDIRCITNIYACAASIYLHAVVSGARPKIPEIKAGVAQTIEALSAISNPEVIKGLTWPICIAACMADGEHRSVFESLESGIINTFGREQRAVRAIGIAKECWRLRDTKGGAFGGKSYDWRDAMASLNERVFLL